MINKIIPKIYFFNFVWILLYIMCEQKRERGLGMWSVKACYLYSVAVAQSTVNCLLIRNEPAFHVNFHMLL